MRPGVRVVPTKSRRAFIREADRKAGGGHVCQSCGERIEAGAVYVAQWGVLPFSGWFTRARHMSCEWGPL